MAAPSDASLPVGSILAGRYQIRRELGRGGMGFVYLCRDMVHDERVALKLMPHSKMQSGSRAPEGSDRGGTRKGRHDDAWFFYEEARALAGLNHPTIVRARDYGVLADGSPYLVMDVAPGRSLHEWIYRAKMDGLLPWPIVWTVIDQVLAGLGHAHARGVIHGDLKPSNILLDRPPSDAAPRVYILDLGLAWLTRDLVDHRLDGSTEVEPTVRYGAGTPGWMAPEQIRMATPHIGPATDLYPLGCLLYTLLVGDEPFSGSNQELLDKHKNDPLPEMKLPAAVPEGVREIVHRLTQKWPWKRYDFAGDARRAWQALRPEGTAVLMPPASGPSETPLESMELVSEISTQPAEPSPHLTITPVATPGLLGLRPTPFVARQEEREHLLKLVWEVCESPEPIHRFVLLSGGAGVGKSRLVEWLCQEVHEQALMIPLRARYRGIAAPLDGIVGGLVQHYRLEKARRATVERVLMNVWGVGRDDEDGKTWVAGAASWLSLHPEDADTVGPTGKRFAVNRPELRWLVMREALIHTARGRPMLIWLDDLHRARAETFQRLARIHRDMSAQRLVLVATMRNEDVTNDTTARARVELLLEDFAGQRMELEPLDVNETLALLRETLPLSDSAVTVAAKRAKGNPLFALQLLHAWAMRGDLQIKNGVYDVPDSALDVHAQTTAELWDERLGALPEPLRGAALAAAALGGDIRRDVLRDLLTTLLLDANRAINAMKRAQLLLLSGTDRLRWTHTLLQEHLLGRLQSQPNAAEIFRAAADALSRHPAASSARIVRHRVTNLLRAGDVSPAAAVLHGHVERSWSQVRDASITLRDLTLLDGRLEGLDLARQLRWRAEAQRYSGALNEAKHDAETARRMAHDAGDELLEAHCYRLLGHIHSDLGTGTQARRQVLRALGLFQLHEHALGRAQCEVLLGEIDYLLGEHARAREELDAASTGFLAVGEVLGRAQCLILQGMVEQASGESARARALIAVARADLETIGYRLGVAQCDLLLAHSDHGEGNFEATHARAAATLRTFHILENPRGEAGCERLLAMNALDSGHPNTAEVHASAAGVLYSKLDDPWGKVESLLLIAQVALYRGDMAGARDALIRCEAVALAEAEPKQHRHLTLAWLGAAEGRPQDAARELDAARKVYRDATQSGDHTPLLLALFDRMGWPEPAGQRVRQWLASIQNRTRLAAGAAANG
jgi:serine/threonine protein kinase/tetratricopeptide (TPR) repeat protein